MDNLIPEMETDKDRGEVSKIVQVNLKALWNLIAKLKLTYSILGAADNTSAVADVEGNVGE